MKKAAETDAGLREEFEALLRDAKKLLRDVEDEVGEKAGEARERLKERLEKAGEKIGAAEDSFASGAEKVDEFVREKPYHALGLTLGFGFILGSLLSRK